MEKINAATLESAINTFEKQKADKEAALRLEQLTEERQKQATAELAKRQEQLIEIQEKEAVFTIADALPLGNDGSLEMYDRTHESDDGIGQTVENTWLYSIEDGVYILSNNEDRKDFGWSGSHRSRSETVWLFARDGSKPLAATGTREDLIVSGPTMNLSNFRPYRWSQLKHLLESLQSSVEHKRLLSEAEEIVDSHGVHEMSGVAGTHAYDRAIVRASIINDTVWRLRRTNRPLSGELPEYTLDYTDLSTKQYFQITLSLNNLKPTINSSSHLAHKETIYRDHLSTFQRGLHEIQEAINPSLCNIKSQE